MDSKIGIVCLSYNQKSNIEKIITDLNRCRHKYKLFVCDDSSNDGTERMLNQMGIDYYREPVNTKNQSRLRNIGVKNIDSEYIIFIDGDDEISSQNLDFLTELLNDINCYDVVLLQLKHIVNENYNYYSNIFSQSENFHCSVSAYCIKKEILLKYNLVFDEDKYNYYSEDVYFCFNLISSMCKHNLNYIELDTNVINVLYKNRENTSNKIHYERYLEYMQEMKNDLLNLCEKDIHYKITNYFNNDVENYNSLKDGYKNGNIIML